MKKIKDNIVYILLGFTLVISIYSTIKIIELEDRSIENTMNIPYHYESSIEMISIMLTSLQDSRSENEIRIDNYEREVSDLEDELEELKITLRMNLNIIIN